MHVRAHRLSRRAGPQPGQRGYVAAGIETMLRTARTLASGHDLPTVVGKAFRQLAAFGAASLQAALAPIIERGNIDAWQMRAPAWSCRRTLPPVTRAGPCCGRGRFWPRSVPWVRATCRGERKAGTAFGGRAREVQPAPPPVLPAGASPGSTVLPATTRLPPGARVTSTRRAWAFGDAGMVTCRTPSA